MKKWWYDVDYRIEVARHAHDQGELRTPDEIFYFLEKPWKFEELEVMYDNWLCAEGEAQDEFNAREP